MIETPKNLTRNILLGMFLGFVVGSLLYYVSFFSDSFLEFIKVYVFNLGSAIFINLLKLLIVPLVFFSLVSGISSLTSMQSLGNITLKTITLYLLAPSLNQAQGIRQKLHRQISYQKVRGYMKQF